MFRKFLVCIFVVSTLMITTMFASPISMAQSPCDIPNGMHHFLSAWTMQAIQGQTASLFMDKQTLYAVINAAGCPQQIIAAFNKQGGSFNFKTQFFASKEYIRRTTTAAGFTRVNWNNLKLPISWAGAQMIPVAQGAVASGAVRAAVVPLVIPKCMVDQQCVNDVASKIPLIRKLPMLPKRPVNN